MPEDIKRPSPTDKIQELLIPFDYVAAEWLPKAVQDTANIWKGPSAMVLSTYKPYNYYSFEVPVDTSFHKGDKLMLNFQAQFLFQEGMRDGVAMLAVTFKNDSVAYNNSRMSSSQSYSIQVEDRDSLGIKSVKGYFLLNVGDFSGAASYTTMKLMFVHHIKLVKLRMKPQPIGNQNARKKSAEDKTTPGLNGNKADKEREKDMEYGTQNNTVSICTEDTTGRENIDYTKLVTRS